jgi:type VI secretion system protein
MSQTIFDILTSDPSTESTESPNAFRSPEEAASVSIRDHLRRLLNCRRGSLAHLPHFGMPDIAALYLELPYTSDRIMACIRRCVADFEPRISHPHVRPARRDDDRDVTRFELVGETHQGHRLKYILSLFRNGSIEVAAGWEQYIHG